MEEYNKTKEPNSELKIKEIKFNELNATTSKKGIRDGCSFMFGGCSGHRQPGSDSGQELGPWGCGFMFGGCKHVS